jgi:hypothetical protein
LKRPAASPPRRRARTIAADGRPSPGRRTDPASGRDPLRAGATTTVATGPAHDVVQLLQSEHRTFDALFDRIPGDPAAAEDIRRELDRHAALEEEIFYPAVGAASDEGAAAIRQAREEHAAIREAAARDLDERAVASLRAMVARHVELEEKVVFAEALRVLGKGALVALAERMEQRNRDLGGTLPLARPRRGKAMQKRR